MKRPVIIALTGSIGMGKSKISSMFRRFGIPVFDADAAVRELQGPGGAALPAIEAAFPGTTGAQGVLRRELGEAVFGNPDALKVLERIIHPLVGRMQRAFLQRYRSRRAVVLDIPLLLEGEGWKHVDLVAVASAPFRVQRARVLARPGMSEDRFLNVLRHQLADARKREVADIVLETGRGRLLTYRTVRDIARASVGSRIA